MFEPWSNEKAIADGLVEIGGMIACFVGLVILAEAVFYLVFG